MNTTFVNLAHGVPYCGEDTAPAKNMWFVNFLATISVVPVFRVINQLGIVIIRELVTGVLAKAFIALHPDFIATVIALSE